MTHFAIREDVHRLYGSGSEVERAAFRELQKVSGIGKQTAERLLLELEGKPVFAGAIASTEPAGVSDDARQTLRALG